MSILFATYLVVTSLTIAANLAAAGADFVRYPQIAINMDRTGVPQSWMFPLGMLKAAGACGLLIGFFVPPVGIAAAVGLVLFFIGAIVTHLRGHNYAFAFPITFLALAVATLVLQLAVAGVR